jgi:hypothetical protein
MQIYMPSATLLKQGRLSLNAKANIDHNTNTIKQSVGIYFFALR